MNSSTTNFQLSTYQEEAINQAKNSNVVINAVAGSGKTSTLKALASNLTSEDNIAIEEILVLVFNKQNVFDIYHKFATIDSLKSRLWKPQIRTLNSLGHLILKKYFGYLTLDREKYKKICKDIQIFEGFFKGLEPIKDRRNFYRLIDLIRKNLLPPTPENIALLKETGLVQGIKDPQWIARAARAVIEVGIQQTEKGIIDFTDQIYMPICYQIKLEDIGLKPFRYILQDECQDLNACQHQLLSLISTPGYTRLFGVGDPKQAIYLFAGAGVDSFSKFKSHTQAEEVTLPICYRCPERVIALVNRLFPDIPIKPRDNAIAGEIASIEVENIFQAEHPAYLQPEDLIICRLKAPLINLCLQLIEKGFSAQVLGSNIKQQIAEYIEDVAALKDFDYARFPQFANTYLELRQKLFAEEVNSEELLQREQDRYKCVMLFWENNPDCQDYKQLIGRLDTVFNNDSAQVKLCTAHKSKGLEAKRVFILKPEELPKTWVNITQEQYQQELNLLYVVLTRTQESLFVIGNPHWLLPEFITESSSASVEVTEETLTPNRQENPSDLGAVTEDEFELVRGIINSFTPEQKQKLVEIIQQDLYRDKVTNILNNL